MSLKNTTSISIAGRVAACVAGLALALAAPPAVGDILHNDDVIILGGHLCVGFDCVNGESFGSDDIRIKENRLRIHFEDTSGGSFPTNDWRILINDLGSGGANYFGIQDTSAGRIPFRVFAGARANALVVDSGGDVGIGTSTPVGDVHIKTGNSPFLRLEQDGTSGFVAQTWDLAGNETNFFVRDVTNGSALPLRIRPDSPGNSLVIDNPDGDIGMGTASPSQALHIRRNNNSNTSVRIENNLADWDFRVNTVGDFAITAAGSGVNEFLLTETDGDLTITGEITTSGSCSIGCDIVFSPDYVIESIDEHAAAMWQNRHLPAVGPTPEQGPMNLSQKTTGMLNELEKAHIYIEQLHRRLEKLERESAERAGSE